MTNSHILPGKNLGFFLVVEKAYKCPLTEVDRAYDEEDPKVRTDHR